jgi:hypothetical protein
MVVVAVLVVLVTMMLPWAVLSGVRKLTVALCGAEELPDSGSRDDPDPRELTDATTHHYTTQLFIATNHYMTIIYTIA